MLGEALDGAGADAVEHGGERQLARLPQLGDPPLEGIADGHDGAGHVGHHTPRPRDAGDGERDVVEGEAVGGLAPDRRPPNDGPRLHEGVAQRGRLLEQRADVGTGDVDAALVALKTQDLVGIDGEGDVGEDLRLERRPHPAHVLRRRTISEMRLMCSALEPQQAPTMLQPASRSAG